jgi:SAM-dependent methyltransferase
MKSSVLEGSAVPRTARDAAAYYSQFGADTFAAGCGRVLDVGAGDSSFARQLSDEGVGVVRTDVCYGGDPPDLGPGAVAALGQRLPFADNSFERVVASWVTPHIPAEDLPALLTELVRVTAPGGRVLVYPLFHVARHLVNEHSFVYEKRFDRRNAGTTLVIHKDPTVAAADWETIVGDVVRTSKLHLGSTLMRLRRGLQRRLIAKAGTNHVGDTISSSWRHL